VLFSNIKEADFYPSFCWVYIVWFSGWFSLWFGKNSGESHKLLINHTFC